VNFKFWVKFCGKNLKKKTQSESKKGNFHQKNPKNKNTKKQTRKEVNKDGEIYLYWCC
jgi:hypothetical protein